MGKPPPDIKEFYNRFAVTTPETGDGDGDDDDGGGKKEKGKKEKGKKEKKGKKKGGKKEKADKSRRKSTFTKMEELTADVKLLQNIAGEDGHLKE